MCMFCRSLFVLLYFFFWPLCCLFFFDIRILITPFVSSNSSFYKKHFLMDPVTNMSDISKSKLIVAWYKSFIVVVNKCWIQKLQNVCNKNYCCATINFPRKGNPPWSHLREIAYDFRIKSDVLKLSIDIKWVRPMFVTRRDISWLLSFKCHLV
jgi:hypothetical protein